MAKSRLTPRRRPSVGSSGLSSRGSWAFYGRVGGSSRSSWNCRRHGWRQLKAARKRENARASTFAHAQPRSERRWTDRAERVMRAAMCNMA